jgi:putative inorganic carbon (HCO3(-)) transporter
VRDIAILVMLIGVIPMILRHPWIGIIAWVVVSVMNPHRMAYGFSYSLPVALLIVIATLLGMLFSKEPKHLPLNSLTVTLLLFVAWMSITFVFALYPDLAYPQWVKIIKIMFMVFVGMMLLNSRYHLHALLWAIVVSLAFYGIKGGIFTLSTGGAFRVYGPPESEVADNNAISFALVMMLPLMYYLSSSIQGHREKLVRWGWYASMVLSTFSILASHSRGAFLALGAMTIFLWLKSKKKLPLGIVIALAIPLLIGFMPEEWSARMSTIQTYEEDASSMGRINTWWMAFNLAKDHPILGGGFQIYEPASFALWAPNPTDIHAAHSIYFAALGEHGYVGLSLFLTLLLLFWRSGSAVIRMSKRSSELTWAMNLAQMLQVSIIGYAVGGAFLSVLYFDVLYYIIMCMVLLRTIVEKEVQATSLPFGRVLSVAQTSANGINLIEKQARENTSKTHTAR